MASNDLKPAVEVIVKLSLQCIDEEAVKDITGAFRKLRNKCAEGNNVQNEIVLFDNLVESTFRVLQTILDSDSITDAQDLCLQVGLQMIANFLVGNREIQSQIWERYQKKLISCLWCDNPKAKNCAVMIMHNVFLGHPEYMVLDVDIFSQIIQLIGGSNPSEFAVYLTQLFIQKTTFIQELYDFLAPNSRLILLDVILDYIKINDEMGEEFEHFFVKKFLSCSENFINDLRRTENSSETHETVRILDLLSAISSNERKLQVIQYEKDLLVTSIKMLKTIHGISKEPGNNLSMVQKLSELNNLESVVKLQEGLSFGVKASLIRLIGNLCWKNNDNKNKVREMEAIPILLDCCSIDGRNPFILQWTILAIRNLCDNNRENQKFIASIGNKGKIDISKMKEMGILSDGDSDATSISIAALKLHE